MQEHGEEGGGRGRDRNKGWGEGRRREEEGVWREVTVVYVAELSV